MANEKIGEKRLNASRIARSLNRSDARKDIHAHLCAAYPKGEMIAQIAEATGYDKEIVLGALLGNKDKYKAEDALVAVGLATMIEEEVYGQKVMIFTAISDGNDIDELVRDYVRNNNWFTRLKEYAKHLEQKLEERKKKRRL